MTCPDAGDTTWVLVSSALVLGMMPGLAFFEAGLLRRKSALSILTQVFVGLALMNLLWWAFGFSLVYGHTVGGVFGDLRFSFLRALGTRCIDRLAPTVPVLAFAVFQSMFAAITPLVMTGAFAERIRIKGFIVLIVLWECLVYYPVCHMVWGEGWIAGLGTQDFAGGIVIHTSAGVSAVCACVVIGRRPGFDRYHGEFPPHNIPLAAVGLALLFTGWIGFNGGSSLSSGFLAVQAVANTVLAASASAFAWGLISIRKNQNRIDPVFIINGTIVGLAAVTPASGFIETWAAVVLGFICGFCAYYSMIFFKQRLRVDDALDVFSMHGVPSIIGTISIGILSTTEVNSTLGTWNGVLYGGSWFRVWFQVVGVTMVAAWSAFITVPLVWTLKRFAWFTLQSEQEQIGLDRLDHEHNAYRGLEGKTEDDEEEEETASIHLH